MIFIDRQDAGKRLARQLERFNTGNTVVLGLPRGGIVLAAKVARKLGAPLGLILVRKIGHPFYPEYAVGAIVEGEQPVYNESETAGIDRGWLSEAETAARNLISKRRELYYGDNFEPTETVGKTVIIVDDGIATGLTMEAAVRAMQNKGARQIVVAAPVASAEGVNILGTIADEVVVLDKPENFSGAVGSHYRKFEQVNDMEVKKLLREASNYVHRKTTRHGQAGQAR